MSAQDWPDELDALIASPRHHTLLFENESVRVVETRVPPGQTTALHTHRWPCALYLLTWSDFVRRDNQGVILLDTRNAEKVAAGSARWGSALPPHTFENVGNAEFRAISVELKDPGRQVPPGNS
jgi:hypothetical protein